MNRADQRNVSVICVPVGLCVTFLQISFHLLGVGCICTLPAQKTPGRVTCSWWRFERELALSAAMWCDVPGRLRTLCLAAVKVVAKGGVCEPS
jgi:hypothetical protein